MHIEMINRELGTHMLVHESRVQEYLDKGHTLADAPAPVKEEPPKKARKRAVKK